MEIASDATWLAARLALLEREKELTRLRDEVTAQRQAMPWKPVDKNYLFADESGESSLSELFGESSQLIVYHFMYGPGWSEGCKSCSFWADEYDAISQHIGARDVSLVVVSRAPWQDFQAFKLRMGWGFRWLSSAASSFNQDFHVSFPDEDKGIYNFTETKVMDEMPGLSVFAKDDLGNIYHTYSLYARGLDPLNSTYQLLDLVPKGRDEVGLPTPMHWIKLHDQYDQ